MKKFLVSVLAIAGLVACHNEEAVRMPEHNQAIAFDTFVDNVTRSAYDNNTLTAFTVYGTMTDFDSVINIFNGVKVSKNSNDVWAYAPEYTQYWLPEYRYDFAAVVDGTVVQNANGMPETINVDMTQQEDVLFATASRDFEANDTPTTVGFIFEHLMAKAKFTVKNTMTAGTGFVYTIESIKIKNADKNGAYDVETGVWAADEAYEADFGFVNNNLAMGSQPVSGSEVYLLPNANKDLQIEVEYYLTYNNAKLKEETKAIDAVLNIEKGKAYNFVVEFGNPGEEIEFEAIVKDWVDGEVQIFQGVSVPVASAQELVDAIADPEVGEAVLTADIDLSQPLTRSGDATPVIAKSFVINGNGNTLTYSGTNRVINITNIEENNDLVVTIKDLTINLTSSYCERGINYNAGGLLIIDNVKFEGTAPTYAVNCPSSSDNAVVKIKDSELTGNIALNLWGENMKVDVTNSILTSVDNVEAENYAAIKLNSDGTNIAEGTIVNIEGGKVIACDEKGEPSYAVSNSTVTGYVNISETTEVVGTVANPVAMIYYNGYSQFYTSTSLQSAINKAIETNAAGVRVIRDIELLQPLKVESGKSVYLDLNGKTVKGLDNNETGSYALITNQGNLTVAGPGKLVVEAQYDRDWNSYSSVISNTVGGNLVVDGGVVIEHLGGTDMAYGIDNLTNGKGTSAVATVKAATVKSTYRAIRQFLNGIEATNELYVRAGAVVEGANKSIWMQDPSKNANTGKLVVEAEAQLKGDVYLYVCEGSTEWPVEVSIASAALVGESTVLSGNVPAQYEVVEENGVWTVNELLPYYKEGNTYHINTAAGLVEVAAISLKGGENIVLDKDIDLKGVEFSGLNAFNPENVNTFDGQGYTVSNWTNNSGASDMGFIRNWVGTIKNVKFENCHLETSGRSAIAAAKVYGNIENVTINNCSLEDSYWACGLVAGLYNAGNISGCTVTNSSIKSNGGTGAIVGVINESTGTRKVESCKVEGCTVNNTGAYGETYSGALICGMINISNSTVEINGCSLANNTKEGKYVGDLYYSADEDVTVTVK